MAIKLPAKVLKTTVDSITGLARWPYNDNQNDPWWEGGPSPRFYRWVMDITVVAQDHSNHLTREPFIYNAIDVKVGDWIASASSGTSLKIIGVTSKTETTSSIIVEDVNRYNTFRDTSANGDGAIPQGNSVIFTLNEEGEPLLDSLPIGYVSEVFLTNALSRFQNINTEYDFNLTQVGHTFQINDIISADLDNNVFVKSTSQYNYTVGKVTALGPTPDQFYITPVQRVIDDLDQLPGTVAQLLYVDDNTPGGVTDVPNRRAIYLKLRNETATSITGTISPISVTATSELSINNETLVFPVGDQADVLSVINNATTTTGVTASTKVSATQTTPNLADQGYGIAAAIGDTLVATINGITVNFDVTTNGTALFGTTAANADDMVVAILRDVTSVNPDITAFQDSSNLFIKNESGGSITLATTTPDGSGFNFEGAGSVTGIPAVTAANTDAFIVLTNNDASAIVFKDILGTPSQELGVYTVENGDKAAALFIEQGIASAGTTVVADIVGRDLLNPSTGEQAMVLDRGNGEWELYLWDGGQWIAVANQDSARTDANSVEYMLNFNSLSNDTLVTISDQSRITLITIEVLTPFNGNPVFTIGDSVITDSVLTDDLHDLTSVGTYSSNTDNFFADGNDVDIISNYTAGGSTEGLARIIISYM